MESQKKMFRSRKTKQKHTMEKQTQKDPKWDYKKGKAET